MRIVKNFLLIIVIYAICTTVYSQEPVKVPGDKVKSVVVYQEKYDILVTRKYKELEQSFDSKGNLLEQVDYKLGKIIKHFRYQYDSDNNKIREEEYDPAGRLIELSEYKFENGLRIEKLVYDGSKKLKSKKTYVYTTY